MAKSKPPIDVEKINARIRELEDLSVRADYEKQLAKARGDASRWRGLAEVFRKEAEDAAHRFDTLLGLDSAKLSHEVSPAPRRGDKHSLSTPLLLVSDLHVEERVLPEHVPGGRNRYDLTIAEERLDQLWRNQVKMIDGQRSSTTIHQAVLFLLGDNYSGWIHPELQHSTQLSPTQCVTWLQPRLTAGIEYLCKHAGLEELHVACIPGNHSRITPQQYSVPSVASLEDVLYRWMASHYQKHAQVRFHIPTASRETMPVGRVRVRYHHGDSWRYNGGLGGMTIPMNRLLQTWSKTERADHDVFGHWHTYTPGAYFTGNGSLIGYNAYGARIAPYEPPQQGFLLVSHKYDRVTVQAPIFVE